MILGKSLFYKKEAEFDTSVKHSKVRQNMISDGVNMLDDFMVWKERGEIKIYDRNCDHNGGRLITSQGKTICPLHGWEFDPKSGKYLNANCHKHPLYEGSVENDKSISVPLKTMKRKLEGFKSTVKFTIRFLNHACLIVNCDGIKFATDPWIFGSAFCNGWWLANPSPNDSIVEINSCDFIYISHNHPDHLHPQTLSKIRKNMPILTACFGSNSTVSMLEDLKFKIIHNLKFTEKWVSKDKELAFSVLKSGDFRDDSGLLVELGNQTVLLNVDSNFLDFWRFPDKVDVLASSFAGGATGFPLCFDNIDPENKSRIIERNKRSIYTVNKIVLQKIKPKTFLPYAGFFKESAKRDYYIKENNLKNSIDDYADLCQILNIKLIDVTKTPLISFNKTAISAEAYDVNLMNAESPEQRIINDVPENELHRNELVQYFENCNFHADLDLMLIPSNENFDTFRDQCFITFKKDGPTKISFEEGAKRRANVNYLQIKVRRYELAKIIQRGLPWEDLLIGFQCRVFREPDIYNVNFWHHFTNVYVSKSVRRRIKDCYGCELISQQI